MTTANTLATLGNGPAFSAYKSNALGTQSITTGTFGKITFDVEDFDTNNNFASSRFTPTVAGYYQINAELDMGGAGIIVASLFKNGSEFKRGFGSSGSEVYTGVSTLVYLNGTTDYVELYGYSTSATGQVYASSLGQYSFINGYLARGA
jgi:hypothetical protein